MELKEAINYVWQSLLESKYSVDNPKATISHDLILDCATRIYISNCISNGNKSSGNKEEKATEKQVDLLVKLGHKGSVDKLTKVEARKLIENLMK